MQQTTDQAALIEHSGTITYRLGAVAYIFWGILHLIGSTLALWFTYLSTAPTWAGILVGVVPGGWTNLEDSTMAIIRHHSWDVALFGLFAVVTASCLNWRNSRSGWLANLVVISIVDTGFILFVLIPGHIEFWLGLVGPALWALGAILTTIGIARAPVERRRRV
jgi:hypothetical protein